jgi:hypothetical protein
MANRVIHATSRAAPRMMADVGQRKQTEKEENDEEKQLGTHH